MNKLLLYVGSLIVLTTAIGCQSRSGNDSYNNPGVQAVTPTAPVPTNNCLMYSNGNGSTPGNQCSYDYGRFQGFYTYQNNPYMAQQGYQSGFCGCQFNYRPVYNSNWGLGCIDPRYTISANNYYYMSFYWNSTNTQWTNIPQVPTSSPVSGSCYRDAVLACDPNAANSCGVNAACVPVNGSSNIGICQFRGGSYSNGPGYR